MPLRRRYRTEVVPYNSEDVLTEVLNRHEGSTLHHVQNHGEGQSLVIYSYPEYVEWEESVDAEA